MLIRLFHTSSADVGPPPSARASSPGRAPSASRSPRLVGRTGTVVHCCGRAGRAAVGGDIWEIRYPAGLLHPGQRVQVVGQWAELLLVLPARDDTHPDDVPVVGASAVIPLPPRLDR